MDYIRTFSGSLPDSLWKIVLICTFPDGCICRSLYRYFMGYRILFYREWNLWKASTPNNK